jgi:hypothetical protein
MKLIPYVLWFVASTAFSQHQNTCEQKAIENTAEYSQAAQIVLLLPEIRSFQQKQVHKLVTNASVDGQTLIGQTCYWEVTVYVNRPDRLVLWQVFLVNQLGKPVLVRDSEGEAITLKKWRQRLKSPKS